MLGARRAGAVALTSRLFGMLYLGLHSVFGSLEVAVVPDHPRPGEGFQLTMANVRTRMVRMAIAGSGIAGAVIPFARREAVAQPSMAEIAPLVEAGSFDGIRDDRSRRRNIVRGNERDQGIPPGHRSPPAARADGPDGDIGSGCDG
jgi:hypothetical protein